MTYMGDILSVSNNSNYILKSPDLFGAGCYNATVALYSTQIEGVLLSFAGPNHGVTQVMFSQDGMSFVFLMFLITC